MPDLPAIDQNICGAWTQQQTDFYNKLPFYFMEGQAKYRKYWPSIGPLFNRIRWKPNQGNTMRRVVSEPTPVLRQLTYPNLLAEAPKADVINYRERIVDSQLHWQDFVTPHFNFLPEFQDFMKHIRKTMENVDRQMMIYEDSFYRSHMWYMSPYVYFAGVGLVDAPTLFGNSTGDLAGSKTNAWIQQYLIQMMAAETKYLSFQEVFKALNAFEQEVGGTPYEGTGMPGEDSNPLNERFCLLGDSETWNNFVDDPWLKENRPLNMNIVTGAFRGDLWGRVRYKHERYSLRMMTDENMLPSFPAPETVELNSDSSQFGRTVPNPEYSKTSNSPIGVAFLVGGKAGDVIEPGPPPAEFIRNLTQEAAIKMTWNGQAYLNKSFLVPCKDANGNDTVDMNSFGRYIRGQGTLALGMNLDNAFNVMPIVYARRIGVNTVT